ncbi:MAG TPA: hypothetical protein VHV83_01860 [Armatimonadota bacterium]|nr:hypothetical protein [Armatimonadota bacterium]
MKGRYRTGLSTKPGQDHYPRDSATSISTCPTIGWQGVSGATSYTLEMPGDAGFTRKVRSFPNIIGTYKVLSGLSARKTY